MITVNFAVISMWIHDRKDWPNFTWNRQLLASRVAVIRHGLERLSGRMAEPGCEIRREVRLTALTQDVVKSSAIEGEVLSPAEVRSSIARRLGMDGTEPGPGKPDVEAMVAMMLDATQEFAKPLTKERLFDWHAALFPTGRSGLSIITVGHWRIPGSGPMQVVSGAIGKEKVHFEAPAAERLENEMQTFLGWFGKDDGMDPIIKAGMAHFWFVTIHPFDDGNGRIGRAIGDMALARADAMADRFYSLSSQLEAERRDYYDQLEKQSRAGLDLTPWLSWFLDCLDRAIAHAGDTLGHVLFKARLWEAIGHNPVNERQRLIINRMLDTDFLGFMNTSKYARMAKCSKDTALRDIQQLKERGLFIQNPGGGRSTSYRLPDREEKRAGQ